VAQKVDPTEDQPDEFQSAKPFSKPGFWTKFVAACAVGDQNAEAINAAPISADAVFIFGCLSVRPASAR
jgi:hypothetical protein